jgi:hypothetical protein
MKRSAMVALLVAALAAALLAQPAAARVAAKPSGLDAILPPGVFGPVQDATCATHHAGLFGFFNGERAGRHDAFADISRICGGYLADRAAISRTEADLPCGPVPDGFVVCSPGGPTFGSPRDLLVFGMQLRGPVPLQLPADQTSRYSLFIDAGGSPSSLTHATAASRDLANQGTNLIYQVISNDPGTTDVANELLAADRRSPDEFISSKARIWLHGSVVVFAVPGPEVGQLHGLRGAVFHGARSAQGDASLGEQNIAPGGVHAPFPLLAYNKVLG